MTFHSFSVVEPTCLWEPDQQHHQATQCTPGDLRHNATHRAAQFDGRRYPQIVQHITPQNHSMLKQGFVLSFSLTTPLSHSLNHQIWMMKICSHVQSIGIKHLNITMIKPHIQIHISVNQSHFFKSWNQVADGINILLASVTFQSNREVLAAVGLFNSDNKNPRAPHLKRPNKNVTSGFHGSHPLICCEKKHALREVKYYIYKTCVNY